MTLTRRTLLAAGAAAPFLTIGPVWADGGADRSAMDGLHLDAVRRVHLGSLAPIRNAAPGADELRGRVCVINFFASWCPPCGPEAAVMTALYHDWADREVRFLSINVFEEFGGTRNQARLDRFLDSHAPPFPVLTGTEETKALFGGVDRIPTLFVFGSDGGIVFRFVHERDAARMSAGREEVEAAIADAMT